MFSKRSWTIKNSDFEPILEKNSNKFSKKNIRFDFQADFNMKIMLSDLIRLFKL